MSVLASLTGAWFDHQQRASERAVLRLARSNVRPGSQLGSCWRAIVVGGNGVDGVCETEMPDAVRSASVAARPPVLYPVAGIIAWPRTGAWESLRVSWCGCLWARELEAAATLTPLLVFALRESLVGKATEASRRGAAAENRQSGRGTAHDREGSMERRGGRCGGGDRREARGMVAGVRRRCVLRGNLAQGEAATTGSERSGDKSTHKAGSVAAS